MYATHEIVRWCAAECERQQSGEMSVWRMYRAWDYARSVGGEFPWAGDFSTDDVLRIAALVDPRNEDGFRRCNVAIGTEVVPITWDTVPRLVQALVGEIDDMDADEWFMHFETIHPFVDGNGRVGAIIYNWMRGTLGEPITAPEYQLPKPMLIGG